MQIARSRINLAIAALAAATGPAMSVAAQTDEQPPNIVIIFTDDQGYGDIGCFGATGFKTPNLDRMAEEGRRFTSFYVAQPVCSASRAALLTGCYANRIGISGALGPNARHGLSTDETTIAEICKSKGYATAIYGKWHLGHHTEFLPLRHGFDEYWGTPYSNDMWPLHPAYVDLPEGAAERKSGYPDLVTIENDAVDDPEVTGEDQMRFTSEITRRAVGFIDRHAHQPFFLYVPHPMPHVPLFTAESFIGSSKQGPYGDVIQEIDWSTGQILDALKRNGIDDNTLVVFTTDNGPWLSYGNHAGSSGPLREGKGTTWEGGVRVPTIMRWPGTVPAGTECDEAAMTIDLLPTIASLIGADLPERRIDGQDITPLIRGEAGAVSPHEALFFYYHNNHLEAVRSGKWKLILPHNYRSLTGEPGMDGRPNGYSQAWAGLELYDLENDLSETTNVAANHLEVVGRMMFLAEQVRDDLGDSLSNRSGTNRREPGRLPEESDQSDGDQ